MITVTANARNAVYTSNDLITSGSIGIPVRFELSADFDGLTNIAVFHGSGESIDVALTGSATCVVPHEVVARPGGFLKIGVYGRNSAGTIVIPTVWAEAKRILQGAEPSGVDPTQPTPDWTAQVQQMATEALEIAQNVEDMSVEAETLPPGSPLNVVKTIDPETGAVTLLFYLAPGRDGVSPTIVVEEISGGHRVTVTDAQGTRSFDVLNGTNGRGIASAVMNADYTLTLTYTDGTSYTTPSLRGEPGADGYSPLASVSKVGKVATISITDKQGTTTATVSDGEDGAPGVGVPVGGTAGQVLKKKTSGTDYDTEWGNEPSVPVQDVQVNGTSILNAQGVANVPMADTNVLGVVRPSTAFGIGINTITGQLYISLAGQSNLKAGTDSYKPVVSSNEHTAAFYGLAKAAGDTTQSASSNPVGQYTDAAKIAIQKMLGVYREWELIAEYTVAEDSAQVNVVTDINGQSFALSEMLVRAWLEPATTGTNDFVSAANIVVNTLDSIVTTSAPTKKYMSNGVATFFEYTVKIMAGVCKTTGISASSPNSTASMESISSSTDSVKFITGFRMSQYAAGKTLIPKDSIIKIYGIRI